MDEVISPYPFSAMARDIGVNPVDALRSRYRYLMSRLMYWLEHDDCYNMEICATVAEVKRVVEAAKKAKMPVRKGEITAEMIQIACDVPIKSLFPGEKDWVLAWCHADKTPSVHVNAVKNVCFCNPCGKVFRTIDVLMSRDGMKFTDAVRYLAGGE